MKKILSIMVMTISFVILASCSKSLKTYGFSFYEYMDTFISVNFMAYDDKEKDQYKEDLNDLFSTYHELTNNYEGLSEDTTYLENIYTINQKIGQKLEIDQALYEIIEDAQAIQDLTDGYFDITIGKAVDVWKDLIESYSNAGVIPESEYLAAVASVEALDVSENQVILSIENDKYYIETKGSDIKLDLGAYAKGYVVDLAAKYLESQGVNYFSVNAGSSSMYVGLNANEERDYFNVGLTCPTCSQSATYGLVKFVENQSVTTSGNYEQFVLYDNLRYHHIVSPITLMPMQYNHSMSLISDDAGLLDALSTALFSMDDETFNQWMSEHQDELDISYIKYSYDETVTSSLLGDLEFELDES